MLSARANTIDVKIAQQAPAVIKPRPLFILNGLERISDINSVNPNDIEAINIIKGAKAIEMYGDRAKDGVIQITTKSKSATNIRINRSKSDTP